MRYKLLKDLPGLNAGAIFEIDLKDKFGIKRKLIVDGSIYDVCSPLVYLSVVEYFTQDGTALEEEGKDWFELIDESDDEIKELDWESETTTGAQTALVTIKLNEIIRRLNKLSKGE